MIQEIFNLLKNYSEKHKVIKSFQFGDSFNKEKTGEDIYPLLFLEYPFNITYNKNFKDISFAYYIIDQPKNSNSDSYESIQLMNKIEILNDILLIKLQLNDFEDFEDLITSNSLTYTEFENDLTVAIRTDLSIRVLRNINSCLDPINN